MTDRKQARARNDSEQARSLEINATIFGPEIAKYGDAVFNLTCGLSQQFDKRGIAPRGIESVAP